MSDQSTPAPRSKPESDQLCVGKTKILQLDYKLAGLFAYLPVCAVNLIASIIWLSTEPKDNRFLRFHACQSLILTAAFIGVGIVVWFVTMILAFIPFLGFLLSLVMLVWWLVTGVYIVMNIVGMINAHRGNVTKFPLIGDIAEKRA